jgi:hypothetical protein
MIHDALPGDVTIGKTKEASVGSECEAEPVRWLAPPIASVSTTWSDSTGTDARPRRCATGGKRGKLKSMEAGGAYRSGVGQPRSDLLHHVDAISLALKNWNDTEALRLLRLYWRDIACALQAQDENQGPDAIEECDVPEAISLPLASAVPPSGADRCSQPFGEKAHGTARDQVLPRTYFPKASIPAGPDYQDSGMALAQNFQRAAKEAKYRS